MFKKIFRFFFPPPPKCEDCGKEMTLFIYTWTCFGCWAGRCREAEARERQEKVQIVADGIKLAAQEQDGISNA